MDLSLYDRTMGNKDERTLQGAEKGSDRQEMVMAALAGAQPQFGPLFRIECFYCAVKGNPLYLTHLDEFAQFEYLFKGLLRLEMMNGRVYDSSFPGEKQRKEAQRWRRFFGTVKKIETSLLNPDNSVSLTLNPHGYSQFEEVRAAIRKIYNLSTLNEYAKMDIRNILKGIWGLLSPDERDLLQKLLDGASLTDDEKNRLALEPGARKSAIEKNWEEFCKKRVGLDFSPDSWKSRITYKLFRDQNNVISFLNKCPGKHWCSRKACPLTDSAQLKESEAASLHALIQCEDYMLPSGYCVPKKTGDPWKEPTPLISLSAILKNHFEKSKVVDLLSATCNRGTNCLAICAESDPASCSTFIQSSQEPKPAAIISENCDYCEIYLTTEATHLHVGYGADMGRLLREPDKITSDKFSIHYRDSRADGTIAPALTISSVRGLFRGSAAFLIESLAMPRMRERWITADYHKSFNKKQGSSTCPLSRYFGGVTEGDKTSTRSCFSFSLCDISLLSINTEIDEYRFAHESPLINVNDINIRDDNIWKRLLLVLLDPNNPSCLYIKNTYFEGELGNKIQELDNILKSNNWYRDPGGKETVKKAKNLIIDALNRCLRVRTLCDEMQKIDPTITQRVNNKEFENLYNAGSSDLHNDDIMLLNRLLLETIFEGVLKKRQKMNIERMNVPEGVSVRVRISPFDHEALALLLLSADLISTGYFRVGRFGSRGYGVLRFNNYEARYGNLGHFIAHGPHALKAKNASSGYELYTAMVGENPIMTMKNLIARHSESSA